MTKARNLSLLSTVEVAATTDQTKADIDALGINRGRKNLIINGGMQVAQRGTSHATTGYGSLDRFQLNLSGGSSTLSQETLSLGETAVPANINKYMRLTTTSGNDNLGFVYNIEGVDTIEGVVTLSLYAKGANPAGGNFSVQVRTYFGTGGSPSSDVTLTEQTLTVTASWTRYDFQFTLPSLTGKTKGTNGNDYIQIFIRQPDAGTAAWTADFTGVQLELGSVATDFEHRSYGEEFALCQRYFQSYGATWFDLKLGQFADTGGVWSGAWSYPNGTMRGVPTIIYHDNVGTVGKMSVLNLLNNTTTNGVGARPFYGRDSSVKFNTYAQATGMTVTGQSGIGKVTDFTLESEL